MVRGLEVSRFERKGAAIPVRISARLVHRRESTPTGKLQGSTATYPIGSLIKEMVGESPEEKFLEEVIDEDHQ
jgi:hypothetical protein